MIKISEEKLKRIIIKSINIHNEEIEKIVTKALNGSKESNTVRESVKKAFIEYYTNKGDIKSLENFKNKINSKNLE